MMGTEPKRGGEGAVSIHPGPLEWALGDPRGLRPPQGAGVFKLCLP